MRKFSKLLFSNNSSDSFAYGVAYGVPYGVADDAADSHAAVSIQGTDTEPYVRSYCDADA